MKFRICKNELGYYKIQIKSIFFWYDFQYGEQVHPGYHIINSLLDTDWYIFTMAQLFLHKHPTAIGRDAFKCRNPRASLYSIKGPSFITTPYYLDWLEQEIDHFCTLKFTSEELKWL